MTPAELHVAVLAALDAAEAADRAASPAPWSWQTRDDRHGTHDVLVDGGGDAVTVVWWDGDRAGLVVVDDDQRAIADLRNTAAAVYVGVRDIVERHAPAGAGDGWVACSTCRTLDKYDGLGEVRSPCPDYRAAARMIPNLPEEIADALGNRP